MGEILGKLVHLDYFAYKTLCRDCFSFHTNIFFVPYVAMLQLHLALQNAVEMVG